MKCSCYENKQSMILNEYLVYFITNLNFILLTYGILVCKTYIVGMSFEVNIFILKIHRENSLNTVFSYISISL